MSLLYQRFHSVCSASCFQKLFAALGMRGGQVDESRASGRAEWNPDDEQDEEVHDVGTQSNRRLPAVVAESRQEDGSEDALALRELADILQSKNEELDRAKRLYQRSITLNPTDVRSLCNFGRLLHASGNFDEAEEMYSKALQLDDEDVDTLNNFAVLQHSVRGREEEAARMYRRVLDLRPSDSHCHSNYATLLLETRGLDAMTDAERHLRRAMELRPDDADALYNFAVLQQELRGDKREAEQALERVMALNPQDTAALYNYAVMQLEEEGASGSSRKAEELCRELVLRSPDDADALSLYADLLAFRRPEGQQDLEEAERLYRKALQLQPSHVDVLVNLGVMLLRGREQPLEALGCFRRALLLAPSRELLDRSGHNVKLRQLCEQLEEAMSDRQPAAEQG